jgi:hypothetical protein
MLATIAGSQFTADLKPQLALLVDDMRTRLGDDPGRTETWRDAHRQAVKDKRTAAAWTDYLEDQLTQAAVGWLLTSVFVRFCEDNLLLGPTAVWITSPDPALRQRALDAEEQFYRAERGEEQGSRSYREWLEEAFAALRENPGTASLVDDHAAIGIMEPSSYAVEQLLGYWRRTDDHGDLVWHFGDPGLSTRFLGDLYQNLSDYAKDKYALLQTPEFVEEFILDRTMEPALRDRPLDGFKLIDPTCGSGHFLLGAFARLVRRWEDEAPGMNSRARIDKALESIHGVDLNPFAVAVAKFRLIVAAMNASGDSSLVNVPRYTLNLAAGDSLLFGPDNDGTDAFDFDNAAVDKDRRASGLTYTTQDRSKLRNLLGRGKYDAVVGNPPYKTPKDKALNTRYRELYKPYCKREYPLAIPFMIRFFWLAKGGDRPGWVGQITSNSFMTREFGIPLIEGFLPTVDLQTVIDSDGAWIPGHNMDGTPTTIIFGRNRLPVTDGLRAVLGMGLREKPDDVGPLGYGPYWQSILDHIEDPGYEGAWISVAEVSREELSHFPWSLSGGGVRELVRHINSGCNRTLRDLSESAGCMAVTGEDDAFMLGDRRSSKIPLVETVQLVEGDEVRNWSIGNGTRTIWPYTSDYAARELDELSSRTVLWPSRRVLQLRKRFSVPVESLDMKWYEWRELYTSKLRNPLTITFAEVASHNHFVLDRGGRIFKQTAPVIKLPDTASEENYFEFLAILNSSTACFWIKHNTKPKGGAAAHRWARTHQLSASAVQRLPFPDSLPPFRARKLERLARAAAKVAPCAVIAASGINRESIDAARREYEGLRSRMIAEQEDLDWEVYFLYGLIDENLNIQTSDDGFGLALGERAFEIALARQMQSGQIESGWFTLHQSQPITAVPAKWQHEHKAIVCRRIDVIANNPSIRLLERPEYKRRWEGTSWDTKLQTVLRDWLLDKIENPQPWANQQGMPQPRSVGELAGELGRDPEFVEALDLWAGRRDAPVAATMVKLLSDQAVPYLAAWRYTDSGLRNRAEWERAWILQRDEDAGLIAATEIPVPPKYTNVDFRKPAYWSHRGKLDVPKERFILYPDAGRATDPTPLLGRADWNHAQQGLALATIYALRESEGVERERLVPLVAGIAEVLPWVKQWHSGVDPNLGVDLYEYLNGQLQEKAQQVGVPVSELCQWSPPATARGRKTKGR